MARPKGSMQKVRDESKYWLPKGITLINPPEQYNKTTLLTFLDSQHGEFVSYFRALQDANASTHKEAVKARREATNIAIYGIKNAGGTKESREKASNTMFEKFGVKHARQNKEYNDKAKATLKTNYGVENPVDSEELRNKQKQTLKNRYNVENPMHSDVIKEKQKETVISVYGVANVMSVPEISKKQKENLRISKKSKKLPNGKFVSDYCEEFGLSSSCGIYKIIRDYGLDVGQDFIENYTKTMTSLEIKFKRIFPNSVYINKKLSENVPYKVDFQLSPTFYVEVDGLIYHSNLYKKDNKYHFTKREIFENNNLTLLQFRQDEIVNKKEIVESIIKTKLNQVDNRYFARKLTIKQLSIEEAKVFLMENHLMGFCNAKHLGLFDNNTLVCYFGYKKHKDGIDVTRFCSKLNSVVVGGLSKFLSYVTKLEKPKFIQSYVDLRYGNGASLKKLGFTLDKITLGWKWTDGYKTFNRLYCTANMDERKLTERQHAEELKLHKIYDAGQAKFLLKL